jgi:hypothetical protein
MICGIWNVLWENREAILKWECSITLLYALKMQRGISKIQKHICCATFGIDKNIFEAKQKGRLLTKYLQHKNRTNYT